MRRSNQVLVREVWEDNAEQEFALIQKAVRTGYGCISMDTEFPGTIFSPPNIKNYTMYSRMSSADQYFWMKLNVDSLKLIQVGLTLCDINGNLPDFGTQNCYIWEINFRDFDIKKDRYNPDSIELLKRQGIDFAKNNENGISFLQFSRLFLKSGLILNPMVVWVTFHGTYDFGYLIKILTGKKLPNNLVEFMALLRYYFGTKVYDFKHIIKHYGLYGGLEKVAKTLQVDRVTGKSHQAGSDSLLTMHTFIKLIDIYFRGESRVNLNAFRGKLHGLELEVNQLMPSSCMTVKYCMPIMCMGYSIILH